LGAFFARRSGVPFCTPIDRYDYNRKGSGGAERLRYLDVKLSDWLFRAIEAAEVLPISREYFRLRSPLDRRIYEIARKHCGKQEKWRISIDKEGKKVELYVNPVTGEIEKTSGERSDEKKERS